MRFGYEHQKSFVRGMHTEKWERASSYIDKLLIKSETNNKSISHIC